MDINTFATSERAFIGSRDPGKLFVMNARDGSIVRTLDIVNTSEDMTVDAAHRHLCITGSTGLDVVDSVGPDRYAVKQDLDTLDGKTSDYIPSLQRLYAVHTKSPDAAMAGLPVFSVRSGAKQHCPGWARHRTRSTRGAI